MTSNESSTEVLQAWGESAAYWDKHRAMIRRMFAPVTVGLVSAAAINEGMNVLDVAGGSGEPSLTLASVVGPEGLVNYTDAVQAMVGAAEAAGTAEGLKNISFAHAPAESLPFGNNSFDAVVCRFGAMFFSDPALACREMLRVARPGAAVAFAVWRAKERNPYLYVVTDVLGQFIPPEPEPPDAPGAFRFAEPGLFAGILEKAGGKQVAESTLDFQIELETGIDEYMVLRAEMSDSLRKKLQSLSPQQRAEYESQAKERLLQFFTNGSMSFPSQIALIKAIKE